MEQALRKLGAILWRDSAIFGENFSDGRILSAILLESRSKLSHLGRREPDDKARVKGAYSYEFIVRSTIIIPFQHFRQWTVPHHSAQTVTAGLVIGVASSYTYLLVGRSMTIKNMGM